LDYVGVSLSPGIVADVPIAFLNPSLVKPRLQKGDRFTLWEAGDFAEGEVLEVIGVLVQRDDTTNERDADSSQSGGKGTE
jgi:hypothetical protein